MCERDLRKKNCVNLSEIQFFFGLSENLCEIRLQSENINNLTAEN